MKKKILSIVIAGICIAAAGTIINNRYKDKFEQQTIEGQAVKPAEENEVNNSLVIENRIKELEDILNNEMFILVNRDNLVDSEYVPNNLVLSEIEFQDYIETRELEVNTAEAAKQMFKAAQEEGIYLLGASGYRSYGIQEYLFNSRVAQSGFEEASKYTAPPGASEHQTGLALDILGTDYVSMEDGFEDSASYEWLSKNAYKYGFILRYPKGKENITGYLYEPWHYRYIGNPEIAKSIMESGMTFEEYIVSVKSEIESLKQQQ